MFGFAVIYQGTDRKGTTVSDVINVDGDMRIAVMWDDDLSFGSVNINDLQGNPVNLPANKGTLTALPGGKDDTIN